MSVAIRVPTPRLLSRWRRARPTESAQEARDLDAYHNQQA